MVRAMWNGKVIAESTDTVVVEGNHYFPLDSVGEGHLSATDTHSTCPWKGTADYYDVVVDGERNSDACWTYPDPKPEAQNLRGRVAFWKGVEVSE